MPYSTRELSKACRQFNSSEIREILTLNPELINQVDAYGTTPLMCLLESNWATHPDLALEALNVLIEHHVDVNLGRDHTRPLTIAMSHVPFFKALISAGADTNYNVVYGSISQSLKEYAELIIDESYKAAIVELISRKENIGKLSSACSLFNLDEIKEILTHSPDLINEYDAFGNTPLTSLLKANFASCPEGIAALRELITRGADLEKPDSFGTKPLTLAITKPALVKELVVAGASTDYTLHDYSGSEITIMDHANMLVEDDNLETVINLLGGHIADSACADAAI